jgi:RNA polymerase sigma-70 factor (ECF subfamily)
MEDLPDHESWKEWFQRHGPKLLLCARLWTRSRADAEDVVQEAFVRFWRRQRGLGGDPFGWVLTSIRRAAVDLARRDQRRTVRENSVEDYSVPVLFVSKHEDQERVGEIDAALRELPTEQREVLTLKIWGERTFEQIGLHLEISPHTAASRYRYALGALRKRLKGADCHG